MTFYYRLSFFVFKPCKIVTCLITAERNGGNQEKLILGNLKSAEVKYYDYGTAENLYIILDCCDGDGFECVYSSPNHNISDIVN